MIGNTVEREFLTNPERPRSGRQSNTSVSITKGKGDGEKTRT